MNKKIIYIPTLIENELPKESSKVGIIKNDKFDFAYWIQDVNTFDHHKSGVHHKQSEISHWLKPTETYVFTQEELEKLLYDYTEAIIADATCKTESDYGRDGNLYDYQVVDEDSIRLQLPEFIKKIKQ